MKKILLSVLILLLGIVIFSGYVTHSWLTKPPSEAVSMAENALADDGLVALGHLNNFRINQLMEFSGLDEESLFINQSDSLLKQLYFAQPNFKQNLNQAVFGLSVNSNKLSSSIILTGTFSLKTIKPVLQKEFDIETINNQTVSLVKKSSILQDKFSCPDDKPQPQAQKNYLYIDSGWLILSDDENKLAQIIERLTLHTEPAIKLTQWREYRNDKLASFGVFVPKDAVNSVKGMAGFIAHGIYKKNPQVNSVYSGIGVNYLPIGMHINGQINAGSQWASDNSTIINQKIKELQASSGDFSETLASLFNNITVHDDENSLLVDIKISKQDIIKMPDVLSEMVSSMFGGSSKRSEEIVAESIDTYPEIYTFNNDLGQVKSFVESTFTGIPAWTSGPFAVNLENAKIGDKTKLLELEIKGMLSLKKSEENRRFSGAELSLSVDSITDIDGNELLRDERCDEEMTRFSSANHQASTQSIGGQDTAEIKKTIRLKDVAKISEVETIKGNLSLNAPVDVTFHDLEFEIGANVQANGFKLSVTETGLQSVSYKIDGDSKNLLDVRALNENGQLLSSSYSMGFSNKTTENFKGNIAKLQIVSAGNWLNKSVEYELDKAQFFKAKSTQQNKILSLPQKVTADSFNKIIKADLAQLTFESAKNRFYEIPKTVGETISGPVKLFLSHDYKSNWNFQPEIYLALPLVESLAGNLQAIELTIDGENIFQQYVDYFPSHRISGEGEILNFVPEATISNQGYSFNKTGLKLDLKSEQKLSELKGRVTYHLPLSILKEEIDLPDLGETKNINGVEITLVEINAGFMPSYVFSVKGESLINLIAITDEGKHYPNQNEFKDGSYYLKYGLNPKLNKLLLISSNTKKTVNLPFTIKPVYLE